MTNRKTERIVSETVLEMTKKVTVSQFKVPVPIQGLIPNFKHNYRNFVKEMILSYDSAILNVLYCLLLLGVVE